MGHNKQLLHLPNIQEVFDKARTGEPRMIIEGHSVSIRRMECFAVKGTCCVRCGLQGTELRLEKWKMGDIHLDLYAYRNGNPILMTVDHIVPKSKGGPNVLSNYQPMCEPCNTKKGSNYEPGYPKTSNQSNQSSSDKRQAA